MIVKSLRDPLLGVKFTLEELTKEMIIEWDLVCPLCGNQIILKDGCERTKHLAHKHESMCDFYKSVKSENKEKVEEIIEGRKRFSQMLSKTNKGISTNILF